MFKILGKALRVGERKRIERLTEMAGRIDSLEPDIQKLTDDQLKARTGEFKQRLDRGEDVDDLLPEAFAVVREAAVRTLGQRHFDVQLMGGIILHEGKIAEMKTGEGKTLVATLPVYLNSLPGKGVHVVTVNDYLAKRDSEWMGPIYKFLGLNVGHRPVPDDHGRAPARLRAPTSPTAPTTSSASTTCATTWSSASSDLVQRGYHYAIVDEVDSILIDEARTPLIISGAAEESAKLYRQFAQIAPRLKKDVDYEVEEKSYSVAITEEGIHKVEQIIGVDNLYDHINTPLVHHLTNALKAKELYQKDVAYVVKNGEVLIVDEFTGRLMPGRRWSDGLHQAVEAKENLRVRHENQTLATVTLQNYFRMYDKLAGMTGTAATEADEFHEIYKLEVIETPTNVPMVRDDANDVIYKSEEAKFNAVVEDIIASNEKGQPVLVGTISIEKSERLSNLLRKRGVPHQVLNAKQHEREAEIVAQAGRFGAVTIATNMAGRGTDIMLGGNPKMMAQQELAGRTELDEEEWKDILAEQGLTVEDWHNKLEEITRQCEEEKTRVIEAGGLYVLGTERHEARRIDNQLRGRSGRQGDPGLSRFYLSLEDDLMRVFASNAIASIMERFHLPEDLPIENRMVTRSIENAQKNVEANNFEVRKNLIKYDDIMNLQRELVYGERQKIQEGQDIHDQVREMIPEVIEATVDRLIDTHLHPEDWELDELFKQLAGLFPVSFGTGRPGPRGAERGDIEGCAYRGRRRGLRPAGGRVRRERPGHPGDRAPGAAQGHRQPLAGPPLHHGLPARERGAAHHGPARSLNRVPERSLRTLPRDDLQLQGRDASLHVSHQRGQDGGATPPLARGGGGRRRRKQARQVQAFPGRQGGQDTPQRPLSLRLRQEVQVLLRQIDGVSPCRGPRP